MVLNQLYMQIFDLFDVKRKGVIDFSDFVKSLNVFHPNAQLEDKIDCKLKGHINILEVFQRAGFFYVPLHSTYLYYVLNLHFFLMLCRSFI